uniref:non-specific serine/threonine protein kinase n=1 Tax=Achlya hypogyna TaxID=1202772 RepID=A0A0A7CNS9_ACHHY|nr:secreted protein [Achlya hypogyna]
MRWHGLRWLGVALWVLRAVATEDEGEYEYEIETDIADEEESTPLFGRSPAIQHLDIDDTTVSAGIGHTCAIHSVSAADFGGKVLCWGEDMLGQSSPPDAEFIQVSCGRFHSCGVKLDETVECWGDPNHAMTPEGLFVQVSCGDFHTCGILKDGTLSCWGVNYDGQLDAPTGKYVQVSCGQVLRATQHASPKVVVGALVRLGCRRYRDMLGCQSPRKEVYQIVGQSTAPANYKFLQVSAAPGDFSCGVTVKNQIRCWGENHRRQLDAPLGSYLLVSTSRLSACGIKVRAFELHKERRVEDKHVVCWGLREGVTSVPPTMRLDELTLGWDHGCGIASDSGKVICWGNPSDDRLAIPPQLLS